jgi:hypothetical protein
LVEVAGAVQKVAEARTFEAVLAPLDLGRRASPGYFDRIQVDVLVRIATAAARMVELVRQD